MTQTAIPEDVVEAAERRALARVREAWAPPPDLSLPEWADKYLYFSTETGGAEKWKTIPYQRGIMEAITDPNIKTVTVMKGARVGYTKVLNAAIGYHAHVDPCGILLVLPTVEDAEGHSKDEIAPTLKVTPVLDAITPDPKSKDSNQTILKKRLLSGMVLTMVGANSPRGFRRLTKRKVFFDEVDGYPVSAGSEGDPITLGKNRTRWAWNAQHVLGSTPTRKGASRIERSWEESNQQRFYVPCPQCDHAQVLRWGDRQSDFGFKWKKGDPESVYYLCEHCHGPIPPRARQQMVEQGVWKAEQPGVKDHAGFHIWAAYSPAPNAAWPQLVREWLQAQGDPEQLRVFVNQVLGEPHEEKYSSLPPNELYETRREEYPRRLTGSVGEDGKPETEQMVPRGAVGLTGAVDIQDDRLECGVEGWGRGEENWKLEYRVFWGDPSSRAVWDELWEYICAPRALERGGEDYIRAVGVDTGGHNFLTACEWCKPRYRMHTPDGGRRYVFAMNPSGGDGALWPREPSTKNKTKVPLYTIRVDVAKDTILARLQKVVEQGPGRPYIHFPMSFGMTYFEQLMAEKSVPRTDKKGFTKRVWEKKSPGRRNEAWDIAVYNLAALHGLRIVGGFDLDRRADQVLGVPDPEPHLERGDDREPDPPRPTPKGTRTRRRRVSKSKWAGR